MRRVLPLALFLVAACANKDAPAPPAARVAHVQPPPAVSTSTLRLAAALAPPSPPPLLGKTVLHAGDSMVGDHWGLTRALKMKLDAEGARIVRHTKVSETLATFERGKALPELLREHDPDIVILTLGTNDTKSPPPEAFGKHVARIAKKIAPRECWWIGPPTTAGKRHTALVEIIEKNCAPCRFFDSSDVTFDRGKDGIHPTDKGGEIWAEAFWEAFRAPSSRGEPLSDLSGRRP